MLKTYSQLKKEEIIWSERQVYRVSTFCEINQNLDKIGNVAGQILHSEKQLHSILKKLESLFNSS